MGRAGCTPARVGVELLPLLVICPKQLMCVWLTHCCLHKCVRLSGYSVHRHPIIPIDMCGSMKTTPRALSFGVRPALYLEVALLTVPDFVLLVASGCRRALVMNALQGSGLVGPRRHA